MPESLESFKNGVDELVKSQLAFYGHIDNQVLAARQDPTPVNREIVDTVEQLLPNTTGFGQAGWFSELTQFLDRKGRSTRPARRGGLELPSYIQAVSKLDERGSSRAPAATEEHDPIATTLSYPAMVLSKIGAVKDRHGNTHDAEDLYQPLRTISKLNPTISRSVTANLDNITRNRDWRGQFDENEPTALAARSQSCFGLLEEVGGQYCSAIYTDYPEVDLTVDDIKQVLNPCNWPQCCSFFHTVRPQDPAYNPDRWNRILETIGPEPDEFLIDTALLFYYGKLDDGGVYLNYDVDPSKENDSGLVEVDSGYICVTPLSEGGGVRIRTSKQERVNGLSPTATSALACFFGWGQVGRFLLADTARKFKAGELELPNRTAFEPSEVGYANFIRRQPEPAGVPDPPPAGIPAHLPPNFGDTVGDLTALSTDLVDAAAGVFGRSVTRWLDGLTDSDVTAISQDIGGQLTTFAEAVYQTAARNVKPELTRPPEPDGDDNG